MNKRQQKFADEYLIDCNATQAAIRAGYSEKTAGRNADRMMKNDEIKAYIEEQLDGLHNEKIADAAEVMMYLTAVLRGEAQSEIVVVENIGDYMSEARKVQKAPDERERLKAAELIGKRYGIFKDNVNVSGTIPVIISDDLGVEDDE